MASEFQENCINGVLEDEEDADAAAADDDDDQFGYLLLIPEKGSLWDLFSYAVFGDIDNGAQFLESSEQDMVAFVAQELRWGMVLIIVIRKFTALFGKSMNWIGYVLDFLLNLLSLNGYLFGLLCNILHGTVVVPQRDTVNFTSINGHLDGRLDLTKKGERLVEDIVASANSEETTMQSQMGNPALMELTIMAAKLAYENAELIRKIVNDDWEMHFVDFYNCWNDFQKEMTTQVFIICDKPKDANFILISFKGRDPFYPEEWSTDVDYSWYENSKLGRLHMGFLEALGLGNRTSPVTFHNHLQKRDRYKRPLEGTCKALSSNSEVTITAPKETFPAETIAMSAYYAVRTKLKSLLQDHQNAKFAVTGHSLGGALASLFTTVLVLHGEMNVIQRLVGVYTFAQPRIGDYQLGRYIEPHLINPVPKYFRVVYCNDFLPRLPYDERNCFYKHFGVCLYYNTQYIEQVMEEEEKPNRNYFGMKHLMAQILNAAWELMRSLTMGYIYGPDYAEGWLSISARMIGLVVPRMTAHLLADYINSVRLGKGRTTEVSSSKKMMLDYHNQVE